MKTFTPKQDDLERKWYVADAEGKVLGRFASQIARILKGKHKPTYSPHLDTGDHVVIVNADKIRVTGNGKLEGKGYTRYTGYPGGLRIKTLRKVLESRPEFVLEHAIRGMLPSNKLGRKMMKKVRIYVGCDHPHQSQRPEPVDFA